ncbi:MAG: hypothetical protein ACW98X_23395 [Promethearchaeota archaeon]|jgi:hypothetical protein
MSDKTKFFDDLLSDYELEFEKFGKDLKRLLSAFIQTGPHTKTEVAEFFAGSGMEKVAQNFVTKYDSVIEYTQAVSKASGIPLVLPDRSLNLLTLYKENQVANILGSAEPILKSVADASFRYGIGESRLDTVIAETSKVIGDTSRRIVTEAITGASIYDRTIKMEQFRHADIEKYFYDGPIDSKNRDECASTLGDSRQFSGWTLADIQSSQTPFITGGGYGCRHEWLPMVEGLNDLVKEMQEDAGIDPFAREPFEFPKPKIRRFKPKLPTIKKPKVFEKPSAETLINKTFPSGAKGGWTHGSVRRESVLMKLAAKEEFGLGGVQIAKRKYNILGSEISAYKSGVRELYESAQEDFKRRGIKNVTLYRGVKKDFATEPILSSWTTDLNTAKRFDHGKMEYILKESVDVKDILTSHISPHWVNGKYGQQYEFIKMVRP